jgi:hypothetical protein
VKPAHLVRPLFDDPNPVSVAGLAPVQRFAEAAGLPGLLAALTVPSPNAVVQTTKVVASVLAGGQHRRHATVTSRTVGPHPTGAPAGPFGDLLRLEDPARQHHVMDADELAGHGQAQPLDQAERMKTRTVEWRLSHVEVFQMGSVRTSIIGGPRPLPQH